MKERGCIWSKIGWKTETGKRNRKGKLLIQMTWETKTKRKKWINDVYIYIYIYIYIYRERERERARERETDRQTDRQRQRQGEISVI